jgi:hypothetical protein
MRSILAGMEQPYLLRILARIFGRVVERNERYTGRIWRGRMWYFEEAR